MIFREEDFPPKSVTISIILLMKKKKNQNNLKTDWFGVGTHCLKKGGLIRLLQHILTYDWRSRCLALFSRMFFKSSFDNFIWRTSLMLVHAVQRACFLFPCKIILKQACQILVFPIAGWNIARTDRCTQCHLFTYSKI